MPKAREINKVYILIISLHTFYASYSLFTLKKTILLNQKPHNILF